MSAALASATMSSTGSSFALPSKVIVPRVRVKVLPSRSTLPRICSSEPVIAGAALVPVILSRPRHSLSSPCPRTKMLPGMSMCDVEHRRAAPAAGSRGRAAACLPVLPLVSTTFSTTTLGGRLSGRLMSARLMVSGAVTLGAVSGPAIDTVPLAVATASSRAATRKLASVAESSAVGPAGAAQHYIALRLQASARIVRRRKRGQREAVAVADEIGLHVGQNRSRREILVARVGEPEAAVRSRRGDRAADRDIGRETAADPVLAERQQIGQVLDLSRTLELQREPAVGRHRNAERRRGQQQRNRAAKADSVAFEPGDLPVQIEVAAVPIAVDRKPQAGQPRMFGRGEGQARVR